MAGIMEKKRKIKQDQSYKSKEVQDEFEEAETISRRYLYIFYSTVVELIYWTNNRP